MKQIWPCLIFFFLISFSGKAQEINLTNTDDIYIRALEEYRAGNFKRSLEYTRRGLKLAPEYHDIRILEIRNLWALQEYRVADQHMELLLNEAPGYEDVKPLVYQRVNRFGNPRETLEFIEKARGHYPEDLKLQTRAAQVYLDLNNRAQARSLALDLLAAKSLTGEDRYILQTILNRTVTNEVGLNYQYIGFSDEYTNYDAWHTISAEFQHNFDRTAVIGRVNYSDREIKSGTLYELEAYPVFSDKFYAFANIGISDGSVFPEYRGSLSFFYNFAKILEAEAGGRLLHFNDTSYFSGILGLTVYWGRFYLNGRAFVGPERLEQMTQNYQFNIRYYYGNADNFLFARAGNGISPDERIIFTQALENPGLEAQYLNAGINFSFGNHHILQLSGGFLTEDLTTERRGSQLMANAGYRYRF